MNDGTFQGIWGVKGQVIEGCKQLKGDQKRKYPTNITCQTPQALLSCCTILNGLHERKPSFMLL